MRPTPLPHARGVVLAGLLASALATGAPAGASAPPTRWAWPVAVASPVVVRGFAPPAQPWLPGHRGVDLLARSGVLVRSAGPGVVHFAGRIGGVGVVSVLHPGGLLTTYEPVRPLVRAGVAVRRGQALGRLTSAGSHCAPDVCLHWGLRRGTAYLDPLALVAAERVRLYPVPASDERPGVPVVPLVGVGVALGVSRVSRAGRRACRAAGALPWCASGRFGSR